SGLEPLVVPPIQAADGSGFFVKVGERCNVAGSRKFLRLISEKKYEEALDIARKQVADGAMVVDVNMDDGLLEAKSEMREFLNMLASDPSVSRVPIMVDSSRFEVIEEGLKCCQGKCIVNSISLKMGEQAFVEHAQTIKRLGAAVIVMLFDEEGQATDYDRRVKIAARAYDILVNRLNFDPSDIIFDPNVLTIATGMAEHNSYAADFIRATRWIIDNLPHVHVSGGLSNLSFAFRGNNYLRESMHSVFLHFAIPNGMGMAIMNPATEVKYKSIPMELRLAITEVIHNTESDASEELIAIASRMTEAMNAAKENNTPYDPKAIFAVGGAVQESSEVKATDVGEMPSTPEDRLKVALQKGLSTAVEPDLLELINRGDDPVEIISGPLMDGMNEVGRLFGEGKMFLPQVVKTARTMKRAVEILQPYIEAGKADGSVSRGKVVIATVKGDVHDIGKNIVSVIMACNGFEMVDLGVMVSEDVIVKAAIEQKADIVSLSGLITPSLEEMCTVAKAMKAAGLTTPIIVGGATTSAIHTAVKIAPCYDGPVFHVRDAASNPGLVMKLLDKSTRDEVIRKNREEQARIREKQQENVSNKPATANAQSMLERRFKCDWDNYLPVKPPFVGKNVVRNVSVEQLIPLISWTFFYWAWRVKADSEEGVKLKADADKLLKELCKTEFDLRCIQGFYPAAGFDDRIKILRSDSPVFHGDECACCSSAVEIMTPRQQKSEGECLALCDYVMPAKKADIMTFTDFVGAFACTVSDAFVKLLEKKKAELGGGDYDVLLLQTVGDRLAEAAAEYMSRELEKESGWKGIRPAVGYPSLPEQKEIFKVAKLIDLDAVGITLTENGAMYPQASVCGLYISHRDAVYFDAK
ncbi:MAG: dihydropteroate synthase, partial [Fibrobacter sp.]|nr:dihydropteroate synthase [Fibrobacter sp.]